MLNINQKVLAKYPGTRFGIMRVNNVTQQDPERDLGQRKKHVESSIKERFGHYSKKQMRELHPFSEYHAYYKRFKKTYHVLHQCESIATGKRTLPNGPLPVQAMFMAEIKNQLLTAGYDCSSITHPYHVSLADGDIGFLGMGEQRRVPPKGDICLSDESRLLGSIICGPDHHNRIRESTTDLLFAIYGVPGITNKQMETHFEDIHSYIHIFSPAAAVQEICIH